LLQIGFDVCNGITCCNCNGVACNITDGVIVNCACDVEDIVCCNGEVCCTAGILCGGDL